MEIYWEQENLRAVAYEEGENIGKCEVIQDGDFWNIVHTEVDSRHQGKGIARKLVEMVIEQAKKENKNLIADCSYARKILGE